MVGLGGDGAVYVYCALAECDYISSADIKRNVTTRMSHIKIMEVDK